MRLKKLFFAASLAGLGLLAAASMTRANTIGPGATAATPDNFDLTGGVSGTLMAFVTGPYATPQGTPPGPDTGVYSEWVVKDSVTGNMDFVYQVSADALNPDDIKRVTGFNSFAGWTTDVGYTTELTLSAVAVPDSGTINPVTIDRSAPSGSTVGFNFTESLTPGSTTLSPGTETNFLVIETNAPSFNAGIDVGVTDGGTDNRPGFAPAAPLPATASMGLGLFGLLALAGIRKATRKSIA